MSSLGWMHYKCPQQVQRGAFAPQKIVNHAVLTWHGGKATGIRKSHCLGRDVIVASQRRIGIKEIRTQDSSTSLAASPLPLRPQVTIPLPSPRGVPTRALADE
eukprot:scaffold58874_cov33-Tisochrysis_lutea.AAC.1